MEVCTIIAKNYLAHARVLARSLVEHNPTARLWVLIIDDFGGYIEPAQEPFEVLTPEDVDCRPFTQMAMRYTVLELSTAVKPWLLRHLMDRTGGPVTYLDPDIKVYGSLEALDRAAAEQGVALTPHNNVPIPVDGHRPSQVDIMIAGTYNLGYVSVAARPEVDRLLDWWGDRLRRDCRVDPVWGYFVDQRWFDLVPGFMTDFAIIRDPEYNVAYWNLHSRTIEHDGSRYLVDGRPLAFFHFSGFDPERPGSLSRHQNRIDIAAHPALEQLLAEYARDVMNAGHAVSRRWRYSYASLGDGTEIDDLLRALHGEFEEELERRGATVPSPFTADGARLFHSWLAEDAPGRPPGVNRVLAHVYELRTDLRRAFPDLSADRVGLLRWAEELGSLEIPLLARVGSSRNGGERVSSSQAMADPPADTPWGVNVVGYFGAAGELGEVARQLMGALDAGGVPAVPVQEFSSPSALESAPFETVSPDSAPYLVNLFCISPGALKEVAAALGHRFFAGRYSIALWLEDVAPPPEALELLQEIWTPNKELAARVADQPAAPVMVLPLPVQPPPFEAASRRQAGLPEDKWLFMAAIESERHNPAGVIEAFKRAFGVDDAAALAIMCSAAATDVSIGELRGQTAGHAGIQVLEAPADRAERLALTALCDCYVSLHRSEPVGTSIAEAMWLGKPVIATARSASLGFVESSSGLLVRSELTGTEAEPDLDHAAALMREAFDDPAAARALGERAASEIRQSHSAAAAAAAIRTRLEAIRSSGQVPRWLAHLPARSTAFGRAHNAVVTGPPATARTGRAYRLRDALRTGVLRVLRPYSSYQHEVNVGLLDALQELGAVAGPARQQAAVERAQLLAELRGARQLRSAVEVTGRAVDELRRIVTLQNDRGRYLALSELAGRHARIGSTPGEPPSSLSLAGFELRGYSQNGEDGVLAEILRRIGAQNRFFVEFGVESGIEGNCVYLADVAGWRGLFMEADDRMHRLLERKYGPRPGIQTQQAMVTPENIEGLLASAEVPRELDVISIDVDGQDYRIWEAIERYQPRVVVIEYNSSLDPHRRLVQPRDVSGWDGTDYFGASLGAIRSLGERKGYQLVHTELAGSNAFLVRAELAAGMFPEAEEVPLRGIPNYFQSGYRHPRDESGRRYLDLDTGEMVPSSR